LKQQIKSYYASITSQNLKDIQTKYEQFVRNQKTGNSSSKQNEQMRKVDFLMNELTKIIDSLEQAKPQTAQRQIAKKGKAAKETEEVIIKSDVSI